MNEFYDFKYLMNVKRFRFVEVFILTLTVYF